MECLGGLRSIFHVAEADPRSVYYVLQALSYLAVYSAVLVGSGVSLWRLGSTLSNCALRPTFVPHRPFFLVLRRLGYPSGCLLIPSLLFAAAYPECFGARLSAAVCATAFHLSDCSRTGAHNGYLMLWNVWTFCILSVRLSLGLAFGAAIWFILSSGLSKLWIGGFGWCYPDTMRSILASFVYKTPKAGGPVLNCLSRMLIRYSFLCGAMGTATVIFEVLYVPIMAVFASRGLQIITAYLMVLLHIGIAIVHSSAIGVFFLPNVASYVVGFYDFSNDPLFVKSSPTAEDWTPFTGYCWFVGVLLNVTAMLYTAWSWKLIAEDWPLTTMALFPWSGQQWRRLHSAFVEGDTRMVAVPPDIGECIEDVVRKRTSEGSSELSCINEIFSGAPVVPIVGAAKLRDDEDGSIAIGTGKAAGNAKMSSLWERIRHNVFGTSPFAKDLRAHTISKASKRGPNESSISDTLLASEQSPIECVYLYDIWTRVLGPTCYQEEFIPALETELFNAPDAGDTGLPVLMTILQNWLRSSKRLVEVSSEKTVIDCAFVKVDSEDKVERVVTWGRMCVRSQAT